MHAMDMEPAGPLALSSEVAEVPPVSFQPSGRARRLGTVAGLMLGYVGVYLCRKNLSVAVPLLQDAFHASKEQVGWITSAGTLAYVLGKLAGPVTDRIGGRAGFLLALCGVAVFGACGALAPGLFALAVAYGLNRVFGGVAWGAMMKLVPTWYRPARIATIVGVLSLSYVLGAIAATLLARQVVAGGGGWRAVMGVPAAVLGGVLLLCALVVRAGPLEERRGERAAPGRTWHEPARALLARPQFLIVCALSFTITLVREAFNTWSVDFLRTVETGAGAVAAAALKSTGFDLAGGASILLMGFCYDRLSPGQRRWLIAGILAVLAGVLTVLQPAAQRSPASAMWLVGLVGLLVYGPYSLLAGVFAVESGGAELAATASGLVDAVGYVAGALAGALLGRILDAGGYHQGFRFLAAVTVVAAVLSLGLRPPSRSRGPSVRPAGPSPSRSG